MQSGVGKMVAALLSPSAQQTALPQPHYQRAPPQNETLTLKSDAAVPYSPQLGNLAISWAPIALGIMHDYNESTSVMDTTPMFI